jgi:hypothetical protein
MREQFTMKIGEFSVIKDTEIENGFHALQTES